MMPQISNLTLAELKPYILLCNQIKLNGINIEDSQELNELKTKLIGKEISISGKVRKNKIPDNVLFDKSEIRPILLEIPLTELINLPNYQIFLGYIESPEIELLVEKYQIREGLFIEATGKITHLYETSVTIESNGSINELNYEPQSDNEALYAVLYAVMAADGHVTDKELSQLRTPVLEMAKNNLTDNKFIEFENDLNEIHKRVVEAHKLLKSEGLIQMSYPLLSQTDNEGLDGIMSMVAKLYYADEKWILNDDKKDKIDEGGKTLRIIFLLIKKLNCDKTKFFEFFEREKQAAIDRYGNNIIAKDENVIRTEEIQKTVIKAKNTILFGKVLIGLTIGIGISEIADGNLLEPIIGGIIFIFIGYCIIISGRELLKTAESSINVTDEIKPIS